MKSDFFWFVWWRFGFVYEFHGLFFGVFDFISYNKDNYVGIYNIKGLNWDKKEEDKWWKCYLKLR